MIDIYLEWLAYYMQCWWNRPDGVKRAIGWEQWLEDHVKIITGEDFPF